MSDRPSNLSAELRNPAYNDESDGHVRLRAADEIDRLTERLAGAYASVNLLTEMLEAKAPQEATGVITAEDLQDAWHKYRDLFGEDPHGTLPQLRALLVGLPKLPHEPLPAPCSECERLRAGLSLIATDEHRLMNITARMTAESILSGKPIGAPLTKGEPHGS